MVAYDAPWKVFIPLRRKTLRAYPAAAMTAAPATVAPGSPSPAGVLVALKRSTRVFSLGETSMCVSAASNSW
ncbi:hypothetical protein PUR71_10745 [Streptomyces sp. SP17BM10]|uniref:hypothetical protein n=1 Tax=Streptomyces sp. SP17BM10 TaxID=3002530 RepID=UPI002E7A96F3|nr:hypothetical protein [Streptomyces sp. SP17BM10]MEE1783388.1 hypothetical protein [Streptomyces sp. SP17BM10]